MTQAFAVRGIVLHEDRASEYLPGWDAALRGVATEHLERVREMGLERGCKTALEFVTVYESWANSLALRVDEQARKREMQRLRESALPADAPCAARDRLAAKYGWGK